MGSSLDTSSLPCEVRIPGDADTVSSFLDRWSNVYCQLPAAVVVPESEKDVIDSLRFARAHNLRVVVSGGKHATFVPITKDTLCLDMAKFSAFSIDEDAKTVTVSAATLTGDVLRGLAAKGYYTCLPNSNAVSIVGCFLGGGNGMMNTLHGFLADQGVSARIITASPEEAITLSGSSSGEQAELWNMLQGAGHGLGVVISLTLKIFPIKELGMTSDKIWTRRLIFPPKHLDIVATTFEQIQAMDGPIHCNLMASRALPGSEVPGEPMIALTVLYFGPASDAMRLFTPLLSQNVTNEAKIGATVLTKIEETNNAAEQGNTHGGFKIADSRYFSALTAQDVTSWYELFARLGSDCGDAKHSMSIMSAYKTPVSVKNESLAERETPLSQFRNRGACIYNNIVYMNKESDSVVKDWLSESKRLTTSMAAKNSEGVCVLPNNFPYPADLSQAYSDEVVARVKQVKEHWDPDGLFWSPAMG